MRAPSPGASFEGSGDLAPLGVDGTEPIEAVRLLALGRGRARGPVRRARASARALAWRTRSMEPGPASSAPAMSGARPSVTPTRTPSSSFPYHSVRSPRKEARTFRSTEGRHGPERSILPTESRRPREISSSQPRPAMSSAGDEPGSPSPRRSWICCAGFEASQRSAPTASSQRQRLHRPGGRSQSSDRARGFLPPMPDPPAPPPRGHTRARRDGRPSADVRSRCVARVRTGRRREDGLRRAEDQPERQAERLRRGEGGSISIGKSPASSWGLAFLGFGLDP